MPLRDQITVTTRYASAPLGLPSLTIPLFAFLPTSPQRTAWETAYSATDTPNVQEITGANWQSTIEDLGVTTGEDLQVLLNDLFGQKLGGAPMQPAVVLLALRAVPVAMVRTATVAGAAAAGNYTTTINGTAIVVPYNASVNQTATDIRTAINAAAVPVTATGATSAIIMTADEAGVPFTSTIAHSTTPADYNTIVTTTPNTGLPEDIADWDAEDPRGYFLLETTRSSGVIQAAAEAWETRTSTYPGQFWFQTDDSTAQAGGSSDIASALIALGLTRSRAFWHNTDDEGVDMAQCGKTCASSPGVPGQQWMKLGSVTGIYAPTLTSTTNLRAKYYSYLESIRSTVPPTSTVMGGKMLDGAWADVVHGADAVNMTVQIRLYQALNDGNIPYFGGEDAVEAAIRGALSEFEGPPGKAFLVAGSVRVTVPPASSQDEADRLARRYDGITWSATVQGKVYELVIEGFLAQ